MRAIAVMRSIASVSISGSGENDISTVSLRKSRPPSGVDGIEGLIRGLMEGVVSKESVSLFDSGGDKRDIVGGLGLGDVFGAGSDSPEHHSKRMSD